MNLFSKRLCAFFFTGLLSITFAFSQEADDFETDETTEITETSTKSDKQIGEFSQNLLSLEGHRFIEIRGAFPVFPMLTSHGVAQSFVAAFTDVFGEIITGGNNYKSTTPKFATDLNLTFFPPIANYRLGFMAGLAIDTWNTNIEKKDVETKETLSMNFAYIGFHGDYGHWVFNEIGTRLSIYGEVSVGWILSDSDSDSKNAFCLDICPFGIQFCPEKHIGIYFEFPHFGARPFFQTGVSIGF